jgi:CDP-glucose 4,6-dehydratase
MNQKFWQGKRVFVTGHTGFKGSWLCLWLNLLGANVTGYALKPPTDPSLFELCHIDKAIESIIADIRDLGVLEKALLAARPEIVIHMAAQPIVRESYKVPVETYATNVMGTVNLLEAVRHCSGIKAVVNVTTDKVYENKAGAKKFKETNPLGGYDPYSNSKACSELATSAYRQSYSMNVATARAGNVIGGGDWAADRLVPDFIRAILKGDKIKIRNPKAVRPWQHVLEPLSGYLSLAEKLYEKGEKYAGPWNFGPDQRDDCSVADLVKELCRQWREGAGYDIDKSQHPHEAAYLRLDSAKAKKHLGWLPRWHLKTTVAKIVEWTKTYQSKGDLRQICFEQIKEYEHA